MSREVWKDGFRSDFGKKHPEFCDRIDIIIDKIFDVIDSEVCDNCIHHKDIEKSYKRCSELEINTSCDFSCNLFKRKGND